MNLKKHISLMPYKLFVLIENKQSPNIFSLVNLNLIDILKWNNGHNIKCKNLINSHFSQMFSFDIANCAFDLTIVNAIKLTM